MRSSWVVVGVEGLLIERIVAVGADMVSVGIVRGVGLANAYGVCRIWIRS